MTPMVSSLVGYTTQYLTKKKEEGVLKTDDDMIRECYYCLRKVFLEMYYKGPVHSDLEKYMTGKRLYKKILAQEKKDGPDKEQREDEIRISSVTFATALRLALAGQNIFAELQVYVPRSLGAWRDAIFMDELDFVIKVKCKRKYYFLEAFNNFDAFGNISRARRDTALPTTRPIVITERRSPRLLSLTTCKDRTIRSVLPTRWIL